MEDKAVSTEDLCTLEHKRNVALSLARLEAILQTLIENKVEALKNDNLNKQSLHPKPKSILKRLRLTSTSSSDLQKPKNDSVIIDIRPEPKQIARKSALKKEASSSSSQLQVCRASSSYTEDDRCADAAPSCCCAQDAEQSFSAHYDDDYTSLKYQYADAMGSDTIMSEEAIRKARRKRRRRRKRRMKKRMALAQRGCLVESGVFDDGCKHITVEDSTKKAKWTIVATAFVLLFMCLLLVGITLRMAPIIDEMVRKENEEFINSLKRPRNTSQVSVQKNNT